MSKYIRTKDNVYKVGATMKIDNNIIEYDCSKIISNNGLTNTMILRHIKITDVIKESDIIEELCDEFVIKYKDEYKYMVGGDKPFISNSRPFSYKNSEKIRNNLKYYDYYGCIWTDKGLIYVAKMNEKGELELL